MQHYYQQVPGWAAFTDLYRSVVQRANAPATFVEVGSWAGKSAAFMGVEIINSGKAIKLYCVDPWHDGGPDLRDTEHAKLHAGVTLYDQFIANVMPVAGVIAPMRMLSVEAAERFHDHSVSFLMIDGDHSYEAVRDDIRAWLPKMRRGGIIAGDDYGWPGVMQAVREAFGDDARVRWINRNRENYKLSAAYWSYRVAS